MKSALLLAIGLALAAFDVRAANEVPEAFSPFSRAKMLGVVPNKKTSRFFCQGLQIQSVRPRP